jgi:hypothetical protein
LLGAFAYGAPNLAPYAELPKPERIKKIMAQKVNTFYPIESETPETVTINVQGNCVTLDKTHCTIEHNIVTEIDFDVWFKTMRKYF